MSPLLLDLHMLSSKCVFSAAAWENGTLAEMSDNSRIIPLSKLTPRMEQYQNDIDAAKQVLIL